MRGALPCSTSPSPGTDVMSLTPGIIAPGTKPCCIMAAAGAQQKGDSSSSSSSDGSRHYKL
jgi:hypothetical protein